MLFLSTCHPQKGSRAHTTCGCVFLRVMNSPPHFPSMTTYRLPVLFCYTTCHTLRLRRLTTLPPFSTWCPSSPTTAVWHGTPFAQSAAAGVQQRIITVIRISLCQWRRHNNNRPISLHNTPPSFLYCTPSSSSYDMTPHKLYNPPILHSTHSSSLYYTLQCKVVRWKHSTFPLSFLFISTFAEESAVAESTECTKYYAKVYLVHS